MGGAAGGLGRSERRQDPWVLVEIDAYVQLGSREAEVRQPRRADRGAPLARVLQQEDARARLEGDEMRAETDRHGPPAAVANRAVQARSENHGRADYQLGPRGAAWGVLGRCSVRLAERVGERLEGG